ncbi:hypothetical protein KDK_80340 [Dictyobacter kobayashii]|uniref:Uncharacterized protein n=1 Tax=Dictyobacter kobayashii TaxID=2014872 RepID=A0A402AYQ7_9CHLR|nr:hypothetical protein KDK_80340 [Dictyobacter kobayashii]
MLLAILLFFSFDLLFMVAINLIKRLWWEIQFLISIAGIGIFGVRADREILLRLPLQDAFALGWIIQSVLLLSEECLT